MAKISIEFNLDNAAYRDYAEYPEEGDINLEAVADSVLTIGRAIEEGKTYGYVIDTNGNKVGSWEIKN